MSRRHSLPTLPEPVIPVPPSRQQHGSLRRVKRQWDSREMSTWWIKRYNEAQRRFNKEEK